MTSREELIKEFSSAPYWLINGTKYYSAELIADFIITDRKRICTPLLEFISKGYHGGLYADNAMKETLTLAGLSEDLK